VGLQDSWSALGTTKNLWNSGFCTFDAIIPTWPRRVLPTKPPSTFSQSRLCLPQQLETPADWRWVQLSIFWITICMPPPIVTHYLDKIPGWMPLSPQITCLVIREVVIAARAPVQVAIPALGDLTMCNARWPLVACAYPHLFQRDGACACLCPMFPTRLCCAIVMYTLCGCPGQSPFWSNLDTSCLLGLCCE
jgi:hypothetical protein